MAEQLEEKLRDALAFADSIIDTMRDPLLVLDGGLRVVRASREFYRAFGVSREETEGRLVYELGDRQWDIPRLRTFLEEVLPQNTTFRDYEVEHVFERIGRKVMLLNARKVYREQNNSAHILLVIEDVTERRDAEEARREEETRFTEMVKNVRDHSIFLTDPEGIITSWNVAAERVMGYTEAEAVGRHFAFIFTPEDLERGLPEWELRTAREQGRAEDERWHVRKGGERFWALGIVTPLRDDKGALTGFSKILRDITERKRMEDYLRQSEEQYRLIVEGARDYAIFTTDPGGLITSWSPGAEVVFGWGAAEAVGRSLEMTFTPEDRAAGAPGQERETAREKGAAPDVGWHLRKDGTRVFIEGVMRALGGGDGGPRGFLKVGQDVTERRRAEEELRRARDELEERVRERTAELVHSQEKALRAERLAAIGQTVTALAHEGRNALQRIAANLSRLEMRQEGRPDELALTGRAQQALGDLERLFDDVRTYAAPVRVDRKACDLSAVWRQAWAQLAPRHAQRDARIEEEAGRTSLECDADPFRLGQVFTNLFANALEACPDPVRVTVACREAELQGRPALRVSVRDNGPGFPAELRARAFEPFQTTKPTGTGLGLAITKRLVEAHGGAVALGDGPGTEVVILLPRRRAQDLLG